MDFVNQLDLSRCPHCEVHRPRLVSQHSLTTFDHSGRNERWWRFYVCATCGGVVTAFANGASKGTVEDWYPRSQYVDEAIPGKARTFLEQAIESVNAPAGSIMLCGSAVDAMLKEKGLTSGTLYDRIELAATQHLITSDMAKWAHEVRLDSNDQRHADDAAQLPTTTDAQRSIDFVRALCEFLFVLPARVQRGLRPVK